MATNTTSPTINNCPIYGPAKRPMPDPPPEQMAVCACGCGVSTCKNVDRVCLSMISG